MMETEELRSKQTRFLEEIKNQDRLNKSLKEEAMLQKQSCEQLESNLNTKNELVSPYFTLLWLYSLEIENSLSLGLRMQLPNHRMEKMWFNRNMCNRFYKLQLTVHCMVWLPKSRVLPWAALCDVEDPEQRRKVKLRAMRSWSDCPYMCVFF